MEEIPVQTIYDNKAKGAGITAKWIRNDELSVTAFRPVLSSTADQPTKWRTAEGTNIYHLRTHCIFDDPLLKEIISDSNYIFKSLQELKMQGSRNEMLKVSRSYRGIIRAYLEKLQEQIAFSEKDESRKCESFITTFYVIEFLWHLCEILLIDPTSTNMVVHQLIEWIRFHYPQSERMAGEFLVTNVDVDSHDSYWATVKGQILQGQIEVVRALLKLHSAAETVPFQIVEQILKTMPVFDTHGGLSVQKFRTQWQYWANDTETKLGLITVPELEDIVKLITGDIEAWNEQARQSQCWYEFFPGFLFYSEPTCKFYELGSSANVWLSRWAKVQPNGARMRLADQITLHMMENDLYQVLHEIQGISDNQWFVTHLTDLLYNCGKLEVLGEQQIAMTTQLRDALLFDYGTALMTHDDFWTHGIDYLEQATEGRAAIELCLSKVHLKDENVAEQVIRECQFRGFPAVESEVCKVMAQKAIGDELLGDALIWSIKSQSSLFATSVADLFLNIYCETGKMACPEILENIGEKMFISPRLVFLIKFFDFNQYCEREEYPQAAELLVNLLDSKITPEFFWPTLLAATIPLLESVEPNIPSKETFQIVHHLETQFVSILEREQRHVSKHGKSRILHNTRLDDVSKLIKLIRGACARNQSRMMIIENTITL